MSCEWSSKLDRYLDSEFPEAEAVAIEAHLRTCRTCAADALVKLQWKRRTQAAARRFVPRPEFRLQIEKSIRATSSPTWFQRWTPALAAAALLLLLLPAAALWQRHTRTEQALGELADLHVSTLASPNPVDVVSSDRHTVKPWFQGKLPFAFNLPELQSSPFQLLGGSLTYFQQSPGAHLLFEIRKHQISVFIFQDRDELTGLNSGQSLTAKLALHSETWTEGGLRYFVLGDAAPADIQALSGLLKSAARM
jgi:anti-sigma factor RsiW